MKMYTKTIPTEIRRNGKNYKYIADFHSIKNLKEAKVFYKYSWKSLRTVKRFSRYYLYGWGKK